MKHLLLIPAFLLLSLCASAQNYEEFKKQREQGVEDLKQQSDKFAKDREAEFKKFKEMYEAEFEKYKKNYNAFLNGEISAIDLMASDDNIKVKPLDDKYKPTSDQIKSSASNEKKVVEKEKADLAKMTSNQALSTLTKSKDKVQRMKDGLAALRTLNKSFEVTSEAVAEPIIERKVVATEKPRELNVVIEDEDSVIESRKEAEEEARRADVEADAKAALEAKRASEREDSIRLADAARRDAEAKNAQTPAPEHKYSGEVSVPKGKPTDYKRISSPFGVRIHPITHKKSNHKGVDMAANNMTPIYATADGTVTYAKWMGGYGNFIKINHENGYKTAYAHLQQIATSNNNKVHRGDLIGYVGSTGQSTGNHLHYEVYFEDKLIDPEKTL